MPGDWYRDQSPGFLYKQCIYIGFAWWYNFAREVNNNGKSKYSYNESGSRFKI